MQDTQKSLYCTLNTNQPATSHRLSMLVSGFKEGNQFQTLLGVTGSDKTFTMANVIAQWIETT